MNRRQFIVGAGGTLVALAAGRPRTADLVTAATDDVTYELAWTWQIREGGMWRPLGEPVKIQVGDIVEAPDWTETMCAMRPVLTVTGLPPATITFS